MNNYFNLAELRQFWHDVEHAPDGKRGFYARSSQKKKRKNQRRSKKGR